MTTPIRLKCLHLQRILPPRLRHQTCSEFNNYFTSLSSLRLTISESVEMVNVQLMRVLTYRLIAHPFLPDEIEELMEHLWKLLSEHSKLSAKLPKKDIYQPKLKLGLGLRHLGIAVHMFFGEARLRYLSGDAPPMTNQSVKAALLSHNQNALQDEFLTAANHLDLRFRTRGPWNPCLPTKLHAKERLFVTSTHCRCGSTSTLETWSRSKRPS